MIDKSIERMTSTGVTKRDQDPYKDIFLDNRRKAEFKRSKMHYNG